MKIRPISKRTGRDQAPPWWDFADSALSVDELTEDCKGDREEAVQVAASFAEILLEVKPCDHTEGGGIPFSNIRRGNLTTLYSRCVRGCWNGQLARLEGFKR